MVFTSSYNTLSQSAESRQKGNWITSALMFIIFLDVKSKSTIMFQIGVLT